MRKLIVIAVLFVFKAWSQTATIPDPNLLNYLKTTFPATIDANDQLIISQAATITSSFNCSNKNISNLEGLQYFTNISTLDASDNQLVSCSQIQDLSKLAKLDLKNNQLTSMPSLLKLKQLRLFFIAKNQLTTIPPLDSNLKLEEIVAYNNKLQNVPSISHLKDLIKIDLGNNQLSTLPTLGQNLRLKYLYVDRNFLLDLPGLDQLDSLLELQVHQNYFTFSDLSPILLFPAAPSILTVSPQRSIAHSDLQVTSLDTLHLRTGTDTNVFNITYKWFDKNSNQLSSSSKDSFYIFPPGKEHEGTYYATITSSDFPSLTLYTDTFQVQVTVCPSAAQVKMAFETITCLKPGKVTISLPGMPVQPYQFTLKETNGIIALNSNTGIFEGVASPSYRLTIRAGTNCTLVYPTEVKVPMEECEEAFFTPNGDSDKDVFYISQQGTAAVIDKDGRVLTTLNVPGDWDGTAKGKRVPPGYYLININNGESVIKLSVLY